MTIDDRIRVTAHSKVRVAITKRKRSAKGFVIQSWDGTNAKFPSKRIALQFLLAVVRCTPERTYKLLPAK